jgi:integrase
VVADPNKDQSLRHLGIVGDTYTILLSGDDTDGRYCLVDMHIPPGGGPPRRGETDVPLVTFNKALLTARPQAGLPEFSFHDCRHFFVSHCVMSGIDFMTIARWVGHQDGGILIGKVYGHLSNEHAQRQAQRVSFGPPAKS